MEVDSLRISSITQPGVDAINRFLQSSDKTVSECENMQKYLEKLKKELEKKRKEFMDHTAKIMVHPEFNEDFFQRHDSRPKERKTVEKTAYSQQPSRREDTRRKIIPTKKIKLGEDMNIWKNTEIFFNKDFPTKEQIEKVFADDRGHLNRLPQNIPGEHWTKIITRFAERNGLPAPICVQNDKVDMSNFWNTNKIHFQIEEPQKKTETTINLLLNALVESAPIERVKKENGPRSRAKKHMLAPRIPYDSYLSLDFDQRLDLELKSIGLGAQSGADKASCDDGPFSEEIEKYNERLNEIVPKLEDYKKKVLPNIDEYIKEYRKMVSSREQIKAKYVDNS